MKNENVKNNSNGTINMTLEELAVEFLDACLESMDESLESMEESEALKQQMLSAPESYFEAFFLIHDLDMENLEEFKTMLIKAIDDKQKKDDRQTQPNLEKLASKFLDEYAEQYKCDWNNQKDAEKLLESIESLEDWECFDFLKANNIKLERFYEFATIATELANSRLQKIKKENTPSQGEETITEEELESIERGLLREMGIDTKKDPENNDRKEPQLPSTISTLPEQNDKVLKSIDAGIDEALKKLNDADYEQIEKILIEEIRNDSSFTETEKEYLINVLKIRLKEKYYQKTNFYQNVLRVFQILDYDHLTAEEKANLIANIKNGKVLKYEEVKHLNISEAEYTKIKNYIIKELEKNHNHAFSTDLNKIYQYYMKELEKNDETYYESEIMNLTPSKIKEKFEDAQIFNDPELIMVIERIKVDGKRIAIQKIINSKEVKKFYEDFIKELETCNTKEKLKVLEKQLKDFEMGNEKLGLSNFNKGLLLEHLKELLKNKKILKNNAQKINDLIEKLKKKIKEFTIEELLEFYEGMQKKSAKDYLNCEELTPEEFAFVKQNIEELIKQELTNKILADLEKNNDHNYETIKNLIKDWNPKVFEKYHIPNEIQKDIQTRLEREIEKKKKKKENSELDEILDINTKVSLETEVSKYDSIYEFSSQMAKKEKIKKGKKGKVVGYIIRKDGNPKEVDNKEDLEKSLKEGYEFVGYNFEYKKRFKKQNTYVLPEEIQTRKITLKNIWKNMKEHWIRTVLIASAILGGLSFAFANWKTNKYYESQNSGVEDSLEPNPVTPPEQQPEEPENEPEETKEQNGTENSILESIPSIDATVKTPESLDNEKIIYSTINDIGTDNKKTAYYKSDSEKIVDGICLESPEGVRKVYQDINEINDLIVNQGYKYIGTRVVNEHSYDQYGNVKDYEGFFGAESINIQDVEESLARRLTR